MMILLVANLFYFRFEPEKNDKGGNIWLTRYCDGSISDRGEDIVVPILVTGERGY